MTNRAVGRVYLRLIAIRTEHIDTLRAFYEAIGIAFTQEQHGEGPVHYAGQVGEAVLEIYPLHEGAIVDAAMRLGFTVSNLREVMQSVKATGADVVSMPRQTPWGNRAVVRDPDGRAVELYEAAGEPQ